MGLAAFSAMPVAAAVALALRPACGPITPA